MSTAMTMAPILLFFWKHNLKKNLVLGNKCYNLWFHQILVEELKNERHCKKEKKNGMKRNTKYQIRNTKSNGDSEPSNKRGHQGNYLVFNQSKSFTLGTRGGA